MTEASSTSFNKTAHGPVSPQTFLKALDGALTRLDETHSLTARQVAELQEKTRSPAAYALWSRVLQNMNPKESLTKERLVQILAADGLSSYNRIAHGAAGSKNGAGVLAALNKEIEPARTQAEAVLIKHGMNDRMAALELGMEGIALQVASIAAQTRPASTSAPQQRSPSSRP